MTKARKDATATDSALARSLKFLLSYQSPEDLHAKRCAGNTLPSHYVARKGWTTQVGQQGGRPALLTYRDGKLRKARYLAGKRENLPSDVSAGLPISSVWKGKRRNFRVLGQVRRGAFEALAVIKLNSSDLIANLENDVGRASGFMTPTQRRLVTKPLKSFPRSA